MQKDPILITHYFYPGTDPWKNIMNLPEKEAFRVAAELADKHPDTTSFGRFADFVNYYPNRKRADEYVREEFIKLGGRPKLMHPYSFVLGECEYLKDWFDANDKLVLNLSDIPDDQISFTLGDSCALLIHGEEPTVLTKAMLLDGINACEGSVEEYCKKSLGKYAYVEVQLWSRTCLITTERLEIRPVEKGDSEAIHRYAGDPSINMMMFLPNETIEETKEFVEFAVSEWSKDEPEDMEFVVLLNGDIIGGVNLEKCEADRTYEIGWIIRKDMRGKGYAVEAAKALKDYAFEVLKAEKIQAHCDSRNQASEKVMKKLGMTLVDGTGTRYYPKTGVSSGEYLYAVKNGDLR